MDKPRVMAFNRLVQISECRVRGSEFAVPQGQLHRGDGLWVFGREFETELQHTRNPTVRVGLIQALQDVGGSAVPQARGTAKTRNLQLPEVLH